MTDKENMQNSSEPNNFGLPEGYFQKSASSIFNRIEWEEEHKNYPNLIQHKHKSGFVVPEDYFNKKDIQSELLDYPKLGSLSKSTGFATPENYFEENEAGQFANLMGERENELEGFEKLNSIKKESAFTVDENYFSINEGRLQTLLKTGGTERVFRLFNVKISYAAAAVLVIALGFWLYNYYFKPVSTGDCGTIACVDRMERIKANDIDDLDNDELYKIVDTKKLEQNIESSLDKTPGKKAADTSIDNSAADDILDGI